MSAEGTVPPARATASLRAALACACVLAACDAPVSMSVDYPAVSRPSPSGETVAFARVHLPCEGPCWSLHIGASIDDAQTVQRLEAGQACSEIAWTKDGARVAFLIDGYQLRIYDARTGRPAGQMNVIEPDGTPPARIVRGLTFSDNGRAVTFDECPRERSGCRAGLVAVPAMNGG